LSKSPFIRALIIEDDGTPAGFGLISFSYSTEVGGLTVLHEDIYISDTCRGKGLGSEFMQFISLETAYPDGLERLTRLKILNE